VRSVVVLGSTGSVGRTTLDVVKRLKDRFRVVGLAARRSWKLLAEQAREFGPDMVALVEPHPGFSELVPAGTEVVSGPRAVEEAASWPEADLVVNALVGSCGVVPTLRAIAAGHDVCIANKETLVVAGEIVSKEVAETGVNLIPIDSEHSALSLCLMGRRPEEVGRLVLTASGGPFRTGPEDLAGVSPCDALRHPVWSMGSKITIDSATMMNKGLEVIEAHWLFGIAQSRIAVLVHPQGVVHGMVEFRDGSTIACLGPADMAIPVQNALTYPEVLTTAKGACDLASLGSLEFLEPDAERFPCLGLARQALRIGGTMPAALSAADEVAVERFLAGELSFGAIPQLIQEIMARHRPTANPSLENVLVADSWAREVARRLPC
jgi:1-deoxy-D-xylulose-5-phosphate reductoisomerase